MKNKTVRLTESAIMLALATVLSVLPILELPYGGSITVCSMLPLCIIAYRHGTKWGIFTGAVYGLLQMLLGMKNVLYFTTPLSIAAVILLDYILAFAALGIAGAFNGLFKKQVPAMLSGTLLASCVRYVLHVIAGATVWAEISIPTEAALAYSLAYNATYMLPETIVLLLGVSLVAGMLDFRNETVGRVAVRGGRLDILSAAAGIAIVATLIFDVREVFSHLQDGETGDFIITGLANVNWGLVGIVTACGAVIAVVLLLVRKHAKNRKNAAVSQ